MMSAPPGEKKDAAAIKAKVMSLAEAGLGPDEIMERMKADDEKEKYGPSAAESETFPDEIRIISQALAFRVMLEGDIEEVHLLLSAAYSCDIEGKEAFRQGPAFGASEIAELFEDKTYQWLIIEAPNGMGFEKDGVILGVCCFTTNGIARRNGEEEGKLGSIRYLAVLPRYRNICVGLRLLCKVERRMSEEKCCRCMVCCSGTKSALMQWLLRRRYLPTNGSLAYPRGIGHTLLPTHQQTKLEVFLKELPSWASLNSPPSTVADAKTPAKRNPNGSIADTSVSRSNTVLSLVPKEGDNSEQGEESDTTTTIMPHEVAQPPSHKLHLPPHWRNIYPPEGSTANGSSASEDMSSSAEALPKAPPVQPVAKPQKSSVDAMSRLQMSEVVLDERDDDDIAPAEMD